MPSSLREDLPPGLIPNAAEFKAYAEGKFTYVTAYNNTLIKAEDSVGEERDFQLATLKQQQEQFEARTKAEQRRFDELQSEAKEEKKEAARRFDEMQREGREERREDRLESTRRFEEMQRERREERLESTRRSEEMQRE
ncbi:unnamed protein product, partial [Ectocarpus fasciculatus]